MNYFSHYIVLGNRTDPYTVLGSILPDIARDSKPQYDGLFTKQKRFSSKEHENLALGIWSHIESDKWFHNSDYFKESTQHIAKVIRDSDKVSLTKYTYFLAHILLELIVDQLLIVENPEGLVSFYEKIRQTSDAVYESFIRENLAEYDAEFFSSKKEQFVEQAFLNNYHNTNTLVNVSYHIFERVGISLLQPDEKEGLKEIINNQITPYLALSYKDMLSTLKTQLWEKSLY